MSRNFKLLPVKIESVPQVETELKNVYKQLNLFTGEVVARDTSKDLFEVYKFNKVTKINKDEANLATLYDIVGTLALKLGELGAIKTIKR